MIEPILDRALIEKYNRPGPRYTSYPTAVHFRDDVDKAALLHDTETESGPISLYYHLPFCESLCWFCACTTVITNNREKADEYIGYLEREMDMFLPHLDRSRKVNQLHFGGGSPSFLEPHQIDRLGEAIHKRFSFGEDAECSVELDARTLTEDKVRSFARAGFRRASFGVQDVNPEVQKAVHRIQPSSLNRQCIDWMRAHGFDSVNVDLIYGLPLQTVDSFAETLTEVLSYNPDRLAIFSYAHVPWVAPAQKILERSQLPTPETKLSMLELIIARLSEAGYRFIGMDHFAKHDDELSLAQANGTMYRNFQGYSTRAGSEICAFGMSAISQTSRCFRQNFKELDHYYAAIDAGHLPIERGYRLTAEDQLRQKVIMRLMCDFELNFTALSKLIGEDFEAHFARELASLAEMESDGLIERYAGGVRVTPEGRLLIRNIAMQFDAYYNPSATRHAKTI